MNTILLDDEYILLDTVFRAGGLLVIPRWDAVEGLPASFLVRLGYLAIEGANLRLTRDGAQAVSEAVPRYGTNGRYFVVRASPDRESGHDLWGRVV